MIFENIKNINPDSLRSWENKLSVQIGKNTKIAGSCTIGDDVWIGPGSNISNGIKIANKARVTIRSTVLRNVTESQTVIGYYAQEHKLFLKKYIGLFKNKK